MRTVQEKLSSLDRNSVWIITKQETDFEESFKSVRLFEEIPNISAQNIEAYFAQNHQRYGISTDRHRILVIPQFFGLLTKTPLYGRGGTYNAEKPTAVFDAIKKCAIGSIDYNKIKTEQILKLKIHAIIDTANNNVGYNILPVIYIYQVLRGLKVKYGIESITIPQLYSYVMTCSKYEELDETIEILKEDPSPSPFAHDYKDLSRVLTLIRKNIKLFIIDAKTIKINPLYDSYFYDNFISRYDLDELHKQLQRDVDYSYFLYNLQKFDIDLIDDVVAGSDSSLQIPKKEVSAYIDDDEDESDYIEKVDSINPHNVNEAVGDGAYSIAPVPVSGFDVSRRFRTNPLLGKIAIQKAYFACEKDYNHETFISKKTKNKYMEAHHLVPVCFQKEMWDKYHINIDCVENLVSLCPTCHKAIHYGDKATQEKMIEDLYNKLVPKYRAIGFNITLDEIKKLYKL